jgi:hypothetical protein
MEWMPEDFHWEYDYEMYDKFFGSGIFCGVGIKMPIHDVTGGDSNTEQQNSSIVVPFSQPPRGTYYSSITP